MKRSKFSEEQVAYALRQAEAGTASATGHVASYGTASTVASHLGRERAPSLARVARRRCAR